MVSGPASLLLPPPASQLPAANSRPPALPPLYVRLGRFVVFCDSLWYNINMLVGPSWFRWEMVILEPSVKFMLW